jgi:hypothetical protein
LEGSQQDRIYVVQRPAFDPRYRKFFGHVAYHPKSHYTPRTV